MPPGIVPFVQRLQNGQRTLNTAVGLAPRRPGLLAGTGALLVLGTVGTCAALGVPLLLTMALGLSLATALVVARSLAAAFPE